MNSMPHHSPAGKWQDCAVQATSVGVKIGEPRRCWHTDEALTKPSFMRNDSMAKANGIPYSRKFIDMTGRRFGELTVVGRAPEQIKRRPAWVCVCDCGRTKTVAGDSLRSGDVTVCGEHRTQAWIQSRIGTQYSRIYPAGTDSKSRVYTIWNAMVARCYRPSHEAYERYGGRGIQMCDEWRSFAGFRQWALSSGYADNLSVDRIDNDKGYEPSNCRWATVAEQAKNRRDSRAITAFGETKLLIDWANDPRCTTSIGTLRKRLASGQPPEFALGASETDARRRASVIRETEKRAARAFASNPARL